MEKPKSPPKGAVEKEKTTDKAGSSARNVKTPPAKQRSNIEKQLVKELDVSLDQARDLVSKSQRKLSIGENQSLTPEEKDALKAKAKKTHAKEKRKAEKDAENSCKTCGIRTHTSKMLGMGRTELKNDNVHYGVCIKCNQQDVPAVVLNAWKVRQAPGAKSEDKKENEEKEEKGGITKTSSKRFAHKIIEEERRANLEKKGMCPDCGIKTHSVTKLSRQPLKNANVHYGVCIKCNPDGVTLPVYQAWEASQNPQKEQGTTSENETDASKDTAKDVDKELMKKTSSKRFADKMIEEDRRKEQEKKGLCPDCGIKTHNVTKLSREPLKNSNVHYGVCIKCNPDGVTPTVYKAWEEGKNNPKEEVDAPKDADKELSKKSSSKRFSDKMIEEDRRKELEKKGMCPKCGTMKTHNVGWFNKEALKNSDVHYGICIKCNPDDVPETARQEWENMQILETRAASEKTKNTSFLSKTFDIPPGVSEWLEANFTQDDISVVVLAGASGKPLKTYMKPKEERKSRRRRSSSHRRESDMAPEEVAALRKDLQEMRKDMNNILHLVESATETEVETDLDGKS